MGVSVRPKANMGTYKSSIFACSARRIKATVTKKAFGQDCMLIKIREEYYF
jgi:hypothetical protein